MSLFLKLFETTAEYNAYTADTANFIKPNVSCTLDDLGTVHYNPLIKVTNVSLNKNELSLSEGDSETLVATVLPSDASNKSVTWSSSDDTVATVSSNGLVTAVATGNTNIIVTTVDGGLTAQCDTTVTSSTPSHDYVEIGGVKWATMNVGATGVTDTGLYFQWGDTQGYTASQVGSGEGQKYFGWADYKYGNGTSSPGATGMTKYNSTDGKTVLDLSDDAARANMGGLWRMPTTAEFQALGNAVNSAWTADYQGSGVAGLICTDKTDSSKALFFPAAGLCFNGSVNFVGSYGYYWSSSVFSSYVQNAYYLGFNSSSVAWQDSSDRYYGFAVRGVLG